MSERDEIPTAELRKLHALAVEHGLPLAADWLLRNGLPDDHFLAYLERASAEVATWPEWKRNLLGGMVGRVYPEPD